MNIKELIQSNIDLGLSFQLASAKVCQDIILKAIASGQLSHNVTIKGGVVMRSITNNLRRSTRDMDFDFIRYSLSDESIDGFIAKLNCLDGIKIIRSGSIEELKHQDYHGKRVYITISDEHGNAVQSKLDIGVHTHLEIEQEDYCFDLCMDDAGACLLINSKEQIFVEKLRSLLIFGPNSNRYKDIYDLFYLKDVVNREKLQSVAEILIFQDSLMRENTWQDVYQRIASTFSNEQYVSNVSKSKQRWTDEDIQSVTQGILEFIESFS